MAEDRAFPERPRSPQRGGLQEGPGPSFAGVSDLSPRDPDAAIRAAAFEHLRKLRQVHGSTLGWSLIAEGFPFRGERIHFASKAEGIFKPRQMRLVLSIKTVIPREGRRPWYLDQTMTRAFPGEAAPLPYAFKGNDPTSARNRLLQEAMQLGLPLIYFFGVSPSRYETVAPAFVTRWDPERLCADIETAVPGFHATPLQPAGSSDERRYALRTTKQRLHQSMFRERVLVAYGRRCALSRLPVPGLVDAAHIVADTDEELGQPDVRNGLCLSRLHHAAYDGGLIGIDPDYRIHVAERLLSTRDGPLLEQIKALAGTSIQLPGDRRCWPDPDRLAVRYEHFARGT